MILSFGVLEIELVIVYYVIACARDYIESLIVIALDTIIPGSASSTSGVILVGIQGGLEQ